MQKYSLRENNLSDDAKKELIVYPELLGQLLYSRGIETRDEAEKFLNPDYHRDTHNSFLLKDMDKTVERILSAINNNEKILIYGDYDADGIPGSVVLGDFFKKINYSNFETYIPHRQNEGYGLNIEAIKSFKKNNFDLIITVDCGVSDFEETKKAQEFGIDVIITDHHIIPEKLPIAFAVVNPKREDCNYPDKNLSGAGVVFKLVQALIEKGDFEIKEGWEKWLLDMVGLATISDMVSLKGENRMFTYFGMIVLKKSPRYGLLHLLRLLKINQKTLTEDDIAFMITPRINAASRIGEPIKAFELLSTDDEVQAGELSKHLNEINNKRKILVASTVKEANKKLNEREVGDVVVVGSPKWNPGISGLVASSLVEKYQKTCFVWGRNGDNSIKGSCRSCGRVDVVELMRLVKEGIFVNIGGHKMAGGFTVADEHIHFLEEKLSKSYKKLNLQTSQQTTNIEVDKKILIDDINWNTFKIIDQLAPFGVDNPKPVFLLENLEVFGIRNFGKQKNHLGIDFLNNNGQKISAIKFFDENKKNIKKGDKINIVANLEKSTFRNVNELRLRIIDFI